MIISIVTSLVLSQDSDDGTTQATATTATARVSDVLGGVSNAAEVFQVRFPDTTFKDFEAAAMILCERHRLQSRQWTAVHEWIEAANLQDGPFDTKQHWTSAAAQLELHNGCS